MRHVRVRACDVVRGIRVVIPQFHGYVITVEQLGHMAYAATLAGIHNHKAGYGIPRNGRSFHNAQRRRIQPGNEFLQAAFLRAGKEQHMRGVKKSGRQHGCKGVKICIGVAGDERCSACMLRRRRRRSGRRLYGGSLIRCGWGGCRLWGRFRRRDHWRLRGWN